MELSKAKQALYASLGNRKFRKRYGLFVVEGAKCVSDTISVFSLECLAATPRWAEAHTQLMDMAADKAALTNVQVLAKISSLSTPPEVIAVYRLPEITEKAELERGALNLLLDGIQDPGNLGTIVRTADWFGFNRIFASYDTADIFNAKAIQASMGSVSRVKVVYCDLEALIDNSHGMAVAGTLLDGKDIFSSDLPSEAAIVMGNEGKGISEAIRRRVTCPLLIPPYNIASHAESLNVGAATAITLALFRNR